MSKEEIVIEKATLENAVNPFDGLTAQMMEIKEAALSLKVTHPSQLDLMEEAGAFHKAMVKIRTTADKKRKEIKAPRLAENKETEAAFKALVAELKPIEDHLKQQHKYVEYQEELRVSKVKEERMTQISASDLDEHINADVLSTIGSLRDDEFDALVVSAQSLKKSREKEAKRGLIVENLSVEILSKVRVEVEQLFEGQEWSKKDIKAMSDGDIEPVTIMLSKDDLLGFFKLIES